MLCLLLCRLEKVQAMLHKLTACSLQYLSVLHMEGENDFNEPCHFALFN